MAERDEPMPDLVLTRTFDAPRDLVFRAWTDAAHLAKWWGPRGFTTMVREADARSGGSLYLEMHGPAGSGYEGPFPMWGTYVEVVEPERIVFTAQLKTAAGVVFFETLNTVTLVEDGDRTRLTLRVHVVTAGPEADGPLSGMREGWMQSLERLDAYLVAE